MYRGFKSNNIIIIIIPIDAHLNYQVGTVTVTFGRVSMCKVPVQLPFDLYRLLMLIKQRRQAECRRCTLQSVEIPVSVRTATLKQCHRTWPK